MKRIIVDNKDGTIAILEPASNWKIEYESWIKDRQLKYPKLSRKKILYKNIEPKKMTYTKFVEFVQWKDVPEGLNSRIVSRSDLPKQIIFRDARTYDFEVDMPRARIIHMDKIRTARSIKFIEMGFIIKLDADIEAAIISEPIREKLKILRDIPKTFDLSVANTPEELASLWPKELD